MALEKQEYIFTFKKTCCGTRKTTSIEKSTLKPSVHRAMKPLQFESCMNCTEQCNTEVTSVMFVAVSQGTCGILKNVMVDCLS